MSIEKVGGPPPQSFSEILSNMVVDLKKKPEEQKLHDIITFIGANIQKINPKALQELAHEISKIKEETTSKDIKQQINKIASIIEEHDEFVYKTPLSNTIMAILKSDAEAVKARIEIKPNKAAVEDQRITDLEADIFMWETEPDAHNKAETGKLFYSIYRASAEKDPVYEFALAQCHYLGMGVEPNTDQALEKLNVLKKKPTLEPFLNDAIDKLIKEINDAEQANLMGKQEHN